MTTQTLVDSGSMFCANLLNLRQFIKIYYLGSSILTKISTVELQHWLGAYRTNALYSGHIFVRFNDLEDVFT